MTEIIGCKGVCDKCEAADICPMKGQFDQAFEEKLSNSPLFGEPLLEKYRELKGKINPQMVIRVHKINLFRLVQNIIIFTEIGETFSPETIKTMIFDAMKPKERQLFENKTPNPLKARALLIIEEMAEVIFAAIQKTCPAKNCQNCWLKEECPQLTAAEKTHA